jgi:hypothetical protein
MFEMRWRDACSTDACLLLDSILSPVLRVRFFPLAWHVTPTLVLAWHAIVASRALVCSAALHSGF